jgi:hypothetical protein
MQIVEIEHLRGSVRVVAKDVPDQMPGNLTASPGRTLAEPDLATGSTQLALLELPVFGAEDPGRPQIVAAVAGTGAGWRRAALMLHDNDRTIELGGTSGVSVMGALVGNLPPHTPMLVDEASEPVVRMLHDAMSLPTGTGDPQSFDAPTLWIDGEIIRYGRADQIGPHDFRLSRLLRGCFGSEDAISNHPSGVQVVLLDATRLNAIDAVPSPIGAIIEIDAIGIGDAVPVSRSLAVAGLAIVPRRPVHGSIVRQGNGDLSLRWIRRDRLSHPWSDGVDIPNSEPVYAFDVDLEANGGLIMSWPVPGDSLTISAAELAVLALNPGTNLEFSVRQLGRFARSPPLIISATL